MSAFLAVILICLNTVVPGLATRRRPPISLSTGVENELSCVMDLQDVVARSTLTAEIGRTAYVKKFAGAPGPVRGSPALRAVARNRPGVPLFA
jgi:hypothetical protein